jgi:hypothetical protein
MILIGREPVFHYGNDPAGLSLCRENLVDPGGDLRGAEWLLEERRAWLQNGLLHSRIGRIAGDEQDAKGPPVGRAILPNAT